MPQTTDTSAPKKSAKDATPPVKYDDWAAI